jgi:hypothetical protein
MSIARRCVEPVEHRRAIPVEHDLNRLCPTLPASRKPAAIAWPISPKPMKQMLGFPAAIVANPR